MTQCTLPDIRAMKSAAHMEALVWRTRYDGLVSIACLHGEEVAGISGPWSGKFALTWWDRPLPQRPLELFDSVDEARRAVEAWAQRPDGGNAVVLARQTPPPRRGAEANLLDRIRGMLPGFGAPGAPRTHRAGLDRLRRLQREPEPDLGGLHFNASDDTHRAF